MAYLGGMIKLEAKTFFVVLGCTLFLAAIAVWFRPDKRNKEQEIGSEGLLNSSSQHRFKRIFTSLALGAFIGFISGMVGIGGGIFLSPLLYLINWDEPKRISAVASLFILVNSISGLLGQFQNGIPDFNWQLGGMLMGSVALGGFIGNYLGIVRFKPIIVRRATAILIAYVSVQLLVKYLF
jgi:uncharacterized membrane protein YfcA